MLLYSATRTSTGQFVITGMTLRTEHAFTIPVPRRLTAPEPATAPEGGVAQYLLSTRRLYLLSTHDVVYSAPLPNRLP